MHCAYWYNFASSQTASLSLLMQTNLFTAVASTGQTFTRISASRAVRQSYTLIIAQHVRLVKLLKHTLLVEPWTVSQ